MSRPVLIRALLAFAILAVSGWVALTRSARLGLDLRGGTQIVLQTRDTATARATSEATDRTVEVLRRRVDALGVSEPTLARSGERRIIVELPGVQDPRQAAEVIGRTAELTFHAVRGIAGPQDKPRPGELVLTDAESGERLVLGPAALTGDDVGKAAAELDPQGGLQWYVTVDFRGGGQREWAQLTGRAACVPPGDPRRRVAIVLDEDVISSPQVDASVNCGVGIAGGSTQITGNFTQAQARDLAVLIQAGALPVPVEIVEQRTVGPTLGAEAIKASAQAALIGVGLTALFIITVYRLLGALATVALAGYALISYAVLVGLGATLTLPGLAGFVLAIGMAVDANVLVFERGREEYAAQPGRGLRSALVTGFTRAWSAIADSNVTTLLAAGLLFFLAAGPVRGFGVTLSIGVLASMVSALLVTRVLAEWAVGRRVVQAHSGVSGLTTLGRVRTWLEARQPNLLRRPRAWLAVSAAVVLLAVAGVAVRGVNLGVEFTGGRLVEYSTSRPVDIDVARAAVAAAGFPRAVVQLSGESDLTVRTGRMSNDEEVRVRDALTRAAGASVVKQRDEFIGPSLGDELRRKALIALGVALAVQLAYLAIRFRWTFATSAVTAMAHDVIVIIGLFAWLGKPIDGVFLAALLTVIGYSVNDSVVVFDRIRERWAASRRAALPRVVNEAVLQTLPRTVNTGLGALFILAALAVLGGESLTDFAIALLVGIGVGTYSSMFTAAPLAVELESRSSAPPPMPRRPASRRTSRHPADSGAVV